MRLFPRALLLVVPMSPEEDGKVDARLLDPATGKSPTRVRSSTTRLPNVYPPTRKRRRRKPRGQPVSRLQVFRSRTTQLPTNPAVPPQRGGNPQVARAASAAAASHRGHRPSESLSLLNHRQQSAAVLCGAVHSEPGLLLLLCQHVRRADAQGGAAPGEGCAGTGRDSSIWPTVLHALGVTSTGACAAALRLSHLLSPLQADAARETWPAPRRMPFAPLQKNLLA